MSRFRVGLLCAFCATLSLSSSAIELRRVIGGVVVPTLINGTPVEPGTWKQTVRIAIPVSGGTGYCTASIVGPRTLATAAHCGTTGSVAKFTLDGATYTAKITRNPTYVENQSSRDVDNALALIDRVVPNISYGVLPNRVDVAKKGMPIQLLGYGCTQSNNGNGAGGNDGILRQGMSKIIDFTSFGFDIITNDGSSGPALCFGDSGGPSFLEVQEGTQMVRYNIAQNSKGNISDTSYLARWDVASSQTFAKNWATTNAQEVCGINKSCNVTTPPPPPPVDPVGRRVRIEGKSVAIDATLKDTSLDADYVETLFQNTIDWLDEQ